MTLTEQRPGRTETPEAGPRRPSPNSRPWLVVLVLALAVVLAGVAGFWFGGRNDGAADPLADETEVPEVVEQWAAAWMEQDAEALAALHAEDGWFSGVFGVELAGREAIAAGIFDHLIHREAVVEPEYVFSDGDVGVLVVWNVTPITEPFPTIYPDQVWMYFEWDWNDPTLLRSSRLGP